MRPLTLAFLLAASLVVSMVSAGGKPVADATEQDQAAARAAYKAAKAAYDQGDLEPALAGFQRSYEIVASPNSHLMVARVLKQMGRTADAFVAMRATMREAEAASKLGPAFEKKYAKTLSHATKLTAELRQGVGLVSVVLVGAQVLPPGAILSVNGKAVEDLAKPVVVDPGIVEATLQTAEGRSEVTSRVAAGGDVTVRLPLPRAAPEPAKLPPPSEGVGVPMVLGISSAAVGGVGIVLFAVFGALTLDQFGELEDACPGNRCPATSQPAIEDGKQYQTLANVGLTIGVAGGIAAVAFFLVDATADTAFLRPSPNGASVGVSF